VVVRYDTDGLNGPSFEEEDMLENMIAVRKELRKFRREFKRKWKKDRAKRTQVRQ